ncbi:hypothetical protein ACFL51_00075 [Myxococcota bacterium]
MARKTRAESGFYSTAAAAEQLGITVSAFRRIVKKKGIQPDKTYSNPHWRSGPPAYLYSRRTIGRLRRMKVVAEAASEVGKRRSDAAHEGVATKTLKLLAAVDAVQVTVIALPIEEVKERAIDSYNDWQSSRRNYDGAHWASPDSAPEFLERIMMNYIRHELTTYDDHLEMLIGMVGKEEAYLELRDKVEEAIDEAYPTLSVDLSLLDAAG